MNEFIELRHVSKTFPGVKALKDVSFNIEKGEIHGLAGENGAGKSTLIKIITGVYKPDDGAEMYVNGKKVFIKTPMDACSLGISVIYQDFSLFGNMTVAENILLGFQKMNHHKAVNWKRTRNKAREILKELEIDIDVNARVEDLSVGKQQMVAIARALAFDSQLLIMDEPTSTLSSAEVEHLFCIMEKLRSKGVSILFVTHKLDEMFRMADRISVFRDGQYITTQNTNELTKDELIRLMVGREVVYMAKPKNTTETDEILLEVEGLSKRGNYKDISFQLHKGEILGITGLVGSGRSEILLTLFGIIKPDSGKIRLKGKEIALSSTAEAEQLGIALIPENRLTEGAFLDKSIKENITVTKLDAIKDKKGFLNSAKEEKIAYQYAEMLDVRPLQMEQNVRNLSGGNQQKVIIAKWLLRDPDILLVDEPTNGIDIGAKTEIHNLLQKLSAQGKSIIVVSSEMLEIISLADRVLVMSKGRISGHLNRDEITQEAMMQAALK